MKLPQVLSEKVEKLSPQQKKRILTLASVAVLATAAIAITLALLTDPTDTIVNEFDPPEIETEIEEGFDGINKTNVTATNSADSTTDVYVRLKFVVNVMEPVYGSDGITPKTYVDEDGHTRYETGDIIVTPSSYNDDGYLENLPITLTNVLDVSGLNLTDWFTDGSQDTGTYYYKYSLAPGESAYDLVGQIYQEVYYEGVVVTLTVLLDSVQVAAFVDDGNAATTQPWSAVSVSAYTDANGNGILYLDGEAGPTANYNTYTQRFLSGENGDTYTSTAGYYSDGTPITPND